MNDISEEDLATLLYEGSFARAHRLITESSGLLTFESTQKMYRALRLSNTSDEDTLFTVVTLYSISNLRRSEQYYDALSIIGKSSDALKMYDNIFLGYQGTEIRAAVLYAIGGNDFLSQREISEDALVGTAAMEAIAERLRRDQNDVTALVHFKRIKSDVNSGYVRIVLSNVPEGPIKSQILALTREPIKLDAEFTLSGKDDLGCSDRHLPGCMKSKLSPPSTSK